MLIRTIRGPQAICIILTVFFIVLTASPIYANLRVVLWKGKKSMPYEQTVYTYQVVGKIFKKTGDVAGELRFSFQSTNDSAAQTMCKAFETFFNNNGTKSNLRIIREMPVKTE